MSAEPKCGFEWIDGVHENEHLCQLPPGDHEHEMHECQCGTVEFIEPAVRPPWRFDVPEVPAHVTAMRDVCDTVWVRQLIDGVDLWLAWLGGEAVYETRQSLRYLASPATLPLVECPDPRAAS